jgi:hypothetical protein
MLSSMSLTAPAKTIICQNRTPGDRAVFAKLGIGQNGSEHFRQVAAGSIPVAPTSRFVGHRRGQSYFTARLLAAHEAAKKNPFKSGTKRPPEEFRILAAPCPF